MTPPAQEGVPASTAAQALEGLELPIESRALLTPAMNPESFLAALDQAARLQDALLFLCHAMPRTEAIRWACDCARSVADKDSSAELPGALITADAWVANPNDSGLETANKIAEQSKFSGIAGLLSIAVIHSQQDFDHLAPEFRPPGDMATRAICGVIMLTVALEGPKNQEKRLRSLVKDGSRRYGLQPRRWWQA